MEQKELSYFGQELIIKVRQRALTRLQGILQKNMKGEIAIEMLNELDEAGDKSTAVLRLAPFIIDSVLHNMMTLLEHDRKINLTVTLDNGEPISIRSVSDGLAGELYGDKGWIKKFTG